MSGRTKNPDQDVLRVSPPEVRRVEWPKTDRPLSIALMGWAELSHQGRQGSGYNLAASELACGLAAKGHRVVYLRSGMDYSVRPGMFIRDVGNWRGVQCFHLFNSPLMSPASMNFKNAKRELSHPAHTARVLAWLEAQSVDCVHIHSLEGFALDLIGTIRDSGRPVAVTPHNYWYVCSQVDLLHQETTVCMDYDGGRKCASCLDAPSPGRAILARRIDDSIMRTFGNFATGTLKHSVKVVKRKLGAWDDPYELTPEDEPQIDPEAPLGFDADRGASNGQIDHGFRFPKKQTFERLGVSALDTNERFLESGDTHLKVLNNVYAKRRIKGIEALGAASVVTPPSEFMAQVYESMGLDRSVVRHVRLGMTHFDQINRRTRRSAFYDKRPYDASDPHRPIRFGFNGTVRNNKGLEILIEAIEMLDQDVRRRAHFAIRAGGWDWRFKKRISRYPEVSMLGGYEPFQLLNAVGEYDVGIMPHVWFENSPLVLLEHLHAGKFVIASRLGGPPEWIHEPSEDDLGNGVMFPGGDPAALAECIGRVVRGDVTIPSPREIHDRSTLWSYPAHVDEIEQIFWDLLDGKSVSRTLDPHDAQTRLPESAPARS